MKTNHEYLTDYLTARRLRGISQTAARALKSVLFKYLSYLEGLMKAAYEVSIRDASEYAGWLKERNLDTNTVVGYVGTAGRFCAWLKEEGVMCGNPFPEIARLRQTRPIPRNLPQPKEMDGLLELLGRWEDEKGLRYAKRRYRMHVLGELLYSTGMRIREAAALRVEDVDVAAGTVRVIDCKTKKPRLCFLNEYARGVLRLYLERLRKWVVKADGPYLFGSRDGSWLGRDLALVLSPLCAVRGLSRLTSHCFRHSVGYHFLKAGCDIRWIQEILGHTCLSSTQVYTKVDREDLRAVIDKFHPRAFSHQFQIQKVN